MAPRSKGGKALSASLDIGPYLKEAKEAWSKYSGWRRKHIKRHEGASPEPEASAALLQAAIAFLEGDHGPKRRAAAAAPGSPARFVQQLCYAHAVKDVADAAIAPHVAPLADGAGAAPPALPRLPDAARHAAADLLRSAAAELAHTARGVDGARSMTALRLRAELLDLLVRLLDDEASLQESSERQAARETLITCVLDGLSPGWEDEAAFVNILMEQPPFAAESVGRRSTLPDLAAAFAAAWSAAAPAHLKLWSEDGGGAGTGTGGSGKGRAGAAAAAREGAVQRCMELSQKAREAAGGRAKGEAKVRCCGCDRWRPRQRAGHGPLGPTCAAHVGTALSRVSRSAAAMRRRPLFPTRSRPAPPGRCRMTSRRARARRPAVWRRRRRPRAAAWVPLAPMAASGCLRAPSKRSGSVRRRGAGRRRGSATRSTSRTRPRCAGQRAAVGVQQTPCSSVLA
jgi:hypothetical protein